NEWPLSRAVQTNFYLQSSQNAAQDRDRGSLSSQLPGKQTPDQYVFDPGNPLWDPTYEQSFPFDQKDIETRKDVLVYTSGPMTEDTEVTGPIVAELYVSSSAKD